MQTSARFSGRISTLSDPEQSRPLQSPQREARTRGWTRSSRQRPSVPGPAVAVAAAGRGAGCSQAQVSLPWTTYGLPFGLTFTVAPFSEAVFPPRPRPPPGPEEERGRALESGRLPACQDPSQRLTRHLARLVAPAWRVRPPAAGPRPLPPPRGSFPALSPRAVLPTPGRSRPRLQPGELPPQGEVPSEVGAAVDGGRWWVRPG